MVAMMRLALLVLTVAVAFAQQAANSGPVGKGGTWAALNFLLGEWIGEGGGGPGQGLGAFHSLSTCRKRL